MTMEDADMNPGMFNRYAYSMNDPINMFDPTGECSEGASDSKTICAVEDAITKVIEPVVEKGMEMAGIEVVPEGQRDPNGEFANEAPDNSVTEEIGAVVEQVVEAGIDTRNPVKIAKKFKCCFVAGTLVETEDGLRPIENIKVGDLVLSRNTDTNITAYKSITDLIRRHERVVWEVSLSGLNGEYELFETTDDHPWWIVGQGWITTDELVSGMSVTTADGRGMIVKSVIETSHSDTTYNLTVADFETYFVGQNKVLVHNCKEHTKNARPSTKAKHEEGQAATQQSRGGEKGDSKRRPNRKPPPGHKGPWPPKK